MTKAVFLDGWTPDRHGFTGPFLSHFAHGIAAAHLGHATEAAEHLTQLQRLMPAVEEEGKYTNVPRLKVQGLPGSFPGVMNFLKPPVDFFWGVPFYHGCARAEGMMLMPREYWLSPLKDLVSDLPGLKPQDATLQQTSSLL